MKLFVQFYNKIVDFLNKYNQDVQKYYDELEKDPEKAQKYYEYLYYLETTHHMF